MQKITTYLSCKDNSFMNVLEITSLHLHFSDFSTSGNVVPQQPVGEAFQILPNVFQHWRLAHSINHGSIPWRYWHIQMCCPQQVWGSGLYYFPQSAWWVIFWKIIYNKYKSVLMFFFLMMMMMKNDTSNTRTLFMCCYWDKKKYN